MKFGLLNPEFQNAPEWEIHREQTPLYIGICPGRASRFGLYLPGMKKKNSVFEVHREKLEDHEMMMGTVQGRLAVLLDILTDSMILAGKHGIYCRNKQNPAEPSLDMQTIMDGLLQSKELVQNLMDEFRKKT